MTTSSQNKTFKTNLWDGFDSLATHSDNVLSFYKSSAKFLKQRASIEENYAKQLARLTDSYKQQVVSSLDQDRSTSQSSTSPSRGIFSPDKSGSLGSCWGTLTEQSERTSSAHNDLSQTFNRLSTDLYTFVKDKESERKAICVQGREQVSALKNQLKALNQAKSNYHSQCKIVEKLQSDITKYQGNPQKQSDLQKSRRKKTTESAKIKIVETDYRKQINTFNAYQEKHVHTLMPDVLNKFESMEKQRIIRFKNIMSEYIAAQNRSNPIIRDSIMTSQFSCARINPDADIQLLIETISSGNPHPQDKKFVGYKGAVPIKTHGELEPEDSPFGGKLLPDIMKIQTAKEIVSDIPILLHLLIKKLIELDATNAQGIFRITGESSEVTMVRGFLSRWDQSVRTHKPHVVATVLKMWIRDLGDGLIPEKAYVNAIEAARENDRDAMFKVFDASPDVNKRVALHLMQFLRAYISTNSTNNMMNIQNLAIVFCPSFLRSPPEEKMNMMINSGAERHFTSVLLEFYPLPEEYVTYYEKEYSGIIEENIAKASLEDADDDGSDADDEEADEVESETSSETTVQEAS